MKQFSLVDTHCHLNLSAFHDDMEAVLERAGQAGVTHIVVPGIDLSSSRAAVALAEKHPFIHAAVGVHPHRATTWNKRVQREIKALASAAPVVAIGEIGLDYYRNLSPPDAQRSTMRELLQLAGEMALPVIVHSRDALDDILEDLLPWAAALSGSIGSRPGVLHAYSGSADQAREICAMRFDIGVGGPITYHKASEYNSVIRELSPDRLLIETDAPYLTPHPHRGQRNEPAYVRFVAQGLSETLQKDLDWTANITSQNAARLFGWKHDT
jgi:TatD DNase family protein